MHIDVAAAGLLAQVLPTLLIFLVLEGRLDRFDGGGGTWRKFEIIVRVLAIFLNLGTTFICIWAVMQNDTIWDGPLVVIDWFIMISIWTLFASAYLTLSRIVLREVRAEGDRAERAS